MSQQRGEIVFHIVIFQIVQVYTQISNFSTRIDFIVLMFN